MILAIFFLALSMIALGFLGLAAALSLVPTDLGFAYLQASTVLTSAGLVILALGFGVRAINQALQRIAAPAPLRADIPMPGFDSSAELPAAKERLVEPLQAGLVVAGAAAAGAAALALGGNGPKNDESVSDRITASQAASFDETLDPGEKALREIERDLFSEMAPAVMVGIETGSGMPQPMDAAAAPLPEDEAEPLTVPDEPGSQAASEPASWPEFPLGPYAKEALAPLPQQADAELAVRADEPAGAEAAEIEMAEAEDKVVKPTTQGLIHDADLEAVGDDVLPALAPLDGLEVVGAYDSGGSRFTMYSDGSVIAAGPEGERRFPSLEALRAHLDGLHVSAGSA